MLSLALQKAEELCHAESSSIWELDDEKKELFFRVVRGRAAGEIQSLRVPLGRGIVGSVALSGQAEIVNEVVQRPALERRPRPPLHHPQHPHRAARSPAAR